MIKKVNDSPLNYTVDSVEQTPITHYHAVCSAGCDVPFNILYIIVNGNKRYVQHGHGYDIGCDCWETED